MCEQSDVELRGFISMSLYLGPLDPCSSKLHVEQLMVLVIGDEVNRPRENFCFLQP